MNEESASCREHFRYAERELLPRRHLCGELLATGIGKAIQLRAPTQLRRAPLRLDPPFALQTVERRIKGAILDEEGVAGRLFDETGDGVAVAWTTG